MTSLLKSPARSPRRVLGDKSTNFTPSRAHASKLNFDNLDQIKANLSGDLVMIKKAPGSPVGKLAGQKRSIEMVDAPERQEQPVVTETPPKSQSETTEEKEEQEETQETQSSVARPFRTMPSFHASQEGAMELEEQFSIHEEASQSMVDNLNATALPENQSQPQFQSFTVHQSQNSQSLSSLIDFDPEEEDKMQAQKTSPVSEKTVVPEEAEARRVAVERKADLLRARLQLAMYKIETDQVNKSFSQLEPKIRRRTRSPSLPPAMPFSPERRVAAARNAATAQPKPQIAKLNEIAAPTLVPTAFSARYMPVDDDGADIPSSPPVSHEEEDEEEEDDAATPRAIPSLSQSLSFKDPRTPSTPSGQLTIPLETQTGENLRTVDRKSFQATNLTSSVMKGEAASGLLELMRTGR